MRSREPLAILFLVAITLTAIANMTHAASTIHVDGMNGSDQNPGDVKRPLKSISAAIQKLEEPLRESLVIEVANGSYDQTGGVGMPSNRLDLMCRMRPGVNVRIVGRKNDSGQYPVMAWEGEPMINCAEGTWWFENLQIGSFKSTQRQGVSVTGPAHVTLKNVTFRTRSQSGAAIHAQRGGKVSLRGAIQINEHLDDRAVEDSFAGIAADDHGLVRFEEHEGASLTMGNGSLSAGYYGVIRLGCETARISNWAVQSNPLAINNGGRIDLHDTVTNLRARNRRNTPIGLEHDGHILAEGARIIVEGENENAIVLQKASTLTCNAVELRGKFPTAVAAMSGSIFVGRFTSDIESLSATTGASVHVEQIDGKVNGVLSASKGGMISLPDRNVFSK